MDHQLPPLGGIPRKLRLERTDITAYDLNPFCFYINYESEMVANVDSKVQEVGLRFSPEENAEEPLRWVMVQNDDRWHRAQVLEKFYNAADECTGAEVSLIDSGRRLLVDVEQIFPMPPEVLAAGPPQSLRIFPKGVQGSPRQILELFESYPEVIFKLTLDQDLSISTKRKPHMAGVMAEVEVGCENFIPLKDLFLSNSIADSQETNGTNRNLNSNEAATNNGGSLSRNEMDNPRPGAAKAEIQFRPNGVAKFEPLDAATPGPSQAVTTSNKSEQRRTAPNSTTPPTSSRVEENGCTARESNALSTAMNGGDSAANGEPEIPTSTCAVAGIQRKNQNSQLTLIGSDDDSSSTADDGPVQESEPNIRYSAPKGAVPQDVEGEKQGEIMAAKSMANTSNTAKLNQRRERFCGVYMNTGTCPNGDVCPHKHGYSAENSYTSTAPTVDFRDYRDIVLRKDFIGFGVCTHVDERGIIYLVLPYDVTNIWDVLALKHDGPSDFFKITQDLSRIHGSQGANKRSPLDPSENLAVVWIDESNSGPLNNVPQGWYRAKIVGREDKKCRVLLVDHGAILMVGREYTHPLGNELLLPQQAIRCELQGTIFQQEPGNPLKMYTHLKKKILILKVYEYKREENIHVVELAEVDNGGSHNHFGHILQMAKIVEWTEP